MSDFINILTWSLVGCVHLAASASGHDSVPGRPNLQAAVGKFLDTGAKPQRDRLGRPVEEHWSTPLLSRLLGEAAKKDPIALGVEASTDVLIACQREQSSILTQPFMRSESQQAHCYRY